MALARILSGLICIAAGTALAQTPAATERITVEGQAGGLQDRVATFVNQVTGDNRHGESLVRWSHPICPAVGGLDTAMAERVLERISDTAREAGAPLGGADCAPNLYVMFTTAPDHLIEQWRAKTQSLFGSATPSEIDRFAGATDPIRAWYGIIREGEDGTPVDGTVGTVPVHNQSRPSLIQLSTVRVFSRVIIIVDGRKMKHALLSQMADYAAMAALTQLDFSADYSGAPTILRAFAESGEPPPKELTDWDRAYLKQLYQTPQRDTFQRSAIIQNMTDAVSGR